MLPKLRLPFNGKYPITFRFGEAPEWYTKVFGYPHNGVDFAMPVDTPIVACDSGTCIYADNLPDSDGMGVILQHDWGISLYWHLNKLYAKALDYHEKGSVIGLSGMTGFATGPHLHWGVKVTEDSNQSMRGWCDPLLYVSVNVIPPAEPTPVLKYYIVRPGDTLWKIAEKFYVSGYYWRKIYEANKDKIRDPALIYPFQKLLIP
jgi:murein DD-endopeptidase MepM/ murein hydrolase activator NlpD